MRKIKSLIWLRINLLLANKNMLILVIMPYIFSLMYNEFMNEGKENSLSILFIGLGMAFSFSTGNMITNMIAEEKEKNNLQTLILSGVNSYEYMVSTLLIPLILGVISILLLPFIVGAQGILEGNYISYFLVSFTTLISVILINLLIATFSNTQAKAQINTLPIMLFTTLIPMFSSVDETLSKINQYSFMGGLTSFFEDANRLSIDNTQWLINIVWIVMLLLLNIKMFRLNKQKKETKKGLKSKLSLKLSLKSV